MPMLLLQLSYHGHDECGSGINCISADSNIGTLALDTANVPAMHC